MVDVDVTDGMEVTLAGLARLSSVGKSANYGVDYTADLLGRFTFLFLWRFMSLLMTCWSFSILSLLPVSFPLRCSSCPQFLAPVFLVLVSLFIGSSIQSV